MTTGFTFDYSPGSGLAIDCKWIQFVRLSVYYHDKEHDMWTLRPYWPKGGGLNEDLRKNQSMTSTTGKVVEADGETWYVDNGPVKNAAGQSEPGYVESGFQGIKGRSGSQGTASMDDAAGFHTDKGAKSWFKGLMLSHKADIIELVFAFTAYLVCDDGVRWRIDWWTRITWTEGPDGGTIKREKGVSNSSAADRYDSEHKAALDAMK